MFPDEMLGWLTFWQFWQWHTALTAGSAEGKVSQSYFKAIFDLLTISLVLDVTTHATSSKNHAGGKGWQLLTDNFLR